MSRFALIGALALLAAACDQPAEAPPAAETAVAAPTAAASPSAPVVPAMQDDPQQGPGFADAVAQFDPTKNHFVWVLSPGVHGREPWTMDVTVKHKGEVKHERKIPLKAEIIPAGTYPEFPAGFEAVRLKDGGGWNAQMAEVGKVVQDIIAKFGRGDGEMVMTVQLHTRLDDAGKKAYCIDKKDPTILIFLEEGTPAKLTKIDGSSMKTFFDKEVLKDCK